MAQPRIVQIDAANGVEAAVMALAAEESVETDLITAPSRPMMVFVRVSDVCEKDDLLGVADSIALSVKDQHVLQVSIFCVRGAATQFSELQDFLQELLASQVQVALAIQAPDDIYLNVLGDMADKDIMPDMINLQFMEDSTHSEEAIVELAEKIDGQQKKIYLECTFQGSLRESSSYKKLIEATKNQQSCLSLYNETLSEESLNIVGEYAMHLVFSYNDQQNESVKIYPMVNFVLVNTKESKFEDMLYAIGRQDLLMTLAVPMPPEDKTKELTDQLRKLLPFFKSVYQVRVGSRDLKDLNAEGDALNQEYLTKAFSKRLELLVTSKEKVPFNKGKVMVLGQGAAGKTSTLRSMARIPFEPEHKKTLVAEKVNIIEIENGDFQMAGVKQDGFMDNLACMASQVFTKKVKVPSPTSKRMLAVKPLSILKRGAELRGKRLKPHIKQSKGKLERGVSSLSVGKKEIFQENDFINLQHTAKHCWWDFGGQRVFDAVHSLYLTKGGILLYVFSLKRLIGVEQKEQMETVHKINNWLSSIKLYAGESKVFMVGTHAEDASVCERLGEAHEIIERLQANFTGIKYIRPKVGEYFFAVENSLKDNHYLKGLREKIKELIKTDETLTWNREVELGWMYFMHQCYTEQRNVISLSEFKRKALECRFEKAEATAMIEFFTAAGEILNFTDYVQDEEKVSIVIKPKWLLEVLSCLICIRDEAEYQDLVDIVADRCSEGSLGLKLVLNEAGILGELLFKKVLREKFNITDEEFELVVSVCEEMLIMSKFVDIPPELGGKKNKNKNKFRYWLVPSYFALADTETKEENRKRGFQLEGWKHAMEKTNEDSTTKSPPSEKIEWSEEAPKSLFGRFVCSVINAGRKHLKSKFKVTRLNGTELCFKIKKKKNRKKNQEKVDLDCEISFISAHEYVLKQYNGGDELHDDVQDIVEEAYKAIQRLALIGDAVVSPECEFYADESSEEEDTKSTVDGHPPPTTTSGPAVEGDKQLFAATKNVNSPRKWDVFLSFARTKSNSVRVAAIKTLLEEARVKVYPCEKKYGEDIASDIQIGVTESRVRLVFITKEYLKDANDKNSSVAKEFNIAAALGVEFIIAIVLDEAFLNGATWNSSIVKIQLGNALYIDFSSKEKIEANMKQLRQRIERAKYTNDTIKKKDVFLSHCWGKDQKCHKIVEGISQELKKNNLDVWFDGDDMGEDVVMSMHAGILHSRIFVAFLTTDYLEKTKNKNTNVAKEFNFATNINVDRVIPVALEPECLHKKLWWQTSVGMQLSRIDPVDFSTPKEREEKMDDLVNRIDQIKEEYWGSTFESEASKN